MLLPVFPGTKRSHLYRQYPCVKTGSRLKIFACDRNCACVKPTSRVIPGWWLPAIYPPVRGSKISLSRVDRKRGHTVPALWQPLRELNTHTSGRSDLRFPGPERDFSPGGFAPVDNLL